MHVAAALLGVALIALLLLDIFETIVLPRRVTRPWRLAQLVIKGLWAPWRAIARRQPTVDRREAALSFYGPLSVILLLAVWVVGLLVGFALLLWAAGSPIRQPDGAATFGTGLYFSATNFFTLGLGDVVPTSRLARTLVAVEAATGFTVLALVISYLPVLYQAFSQREVAVSLLDARAGSPPSAVELLRRHAEPELRADFDQFLRDWELWAAQLMESHLSYPVLASFRSQHDNQSWLAALTTVLDACALIIAGVEGYPGGRARVTFAIARHASVDLSQVFLTPPRPPEHDRLPAERLDAVRAALAEAGVTLGEGPGVVARLTHLRAMYEPYVNALADWLLLSLPDWLPREDMTDNWRSTAWEPRAGARLF